MAHEDEKITDVPTMGILVVDDEEPLRQVLSALLNNGGYHVLQACDGFEALKIYHQEKETINCVLLDFSMPEMDGLEVFNKLRCIDHEVRVILSSGYAEEQLSSDIKEDGFASIVQKPLSMKLLLSKVAEVLT